MKVRVAWGQIIGTRESQQDDGAIASWPNGFELLVLADGMGGHTGGAEASQVVVDSFREHFINDRQEDLRQRLIDALAHANEKVFDCVQENPDLEGMGSTLLALLFDAASVRWISVGDSPLWLYRDGDIMRLNENHSVAALLEEQVARGEISAEQAARDPERSQLLEAVVGNDIERIDVPEEPFGVRAGDIFVLASDGVETCGLDELELLLAETRRDPELIVEKVLSAVKAHERSSQDNATVMVLLAESADPETDTASPGNHGEQGDME